MGSNLKLPIAYVGETNPFRGGGREAGEKRKFKLGRRGRHRFRTK